MTETVIMTQREAIDLAALLTRERDEAVDMLIKANIWCAALGDMMDREAVKRIMARPGIQNGLQQLGEWEDPHEAAKRTAESFGLEPLNR